MVKIASKEKAILDFLTYRRTVNSIDLVIEKLKNHRDDFNLEQLIKLSKNCSLTTQRSLGVVLDSVGIDSDQLYQQIVENKNHSFMTATSGVFNAKWRIYLDKHFANL